MTGAEIIAQQQVAIGMVMAAAAGGVMYALRALPVKLWALAREFFSVTLTVEGKDPLYDHLNIWFARARTAARARRLMLTQEYDYGANEWVWQFTLGKGLHLARVGRRLMLVHREVAQTGDIAQVLGHAASQRLHLTTIGRDQSTIRRVVAEAEAIYKDDGLVRVYFWNEGHYQLADRRPPRALETVFLPEAQKRRIVDDVIAFTQAREEYRRRGTPYRRGYLFGGSPGTGKTSLIFALAGLLGRAVYVINLNNVGGDNRLLSAFNQVGPDGIVVIEDIDTAEITRDRAVVQAEKAAAKLLAPADMSTTSVTLSGLLNAIDGVAAREGRLLFVTSNHAETLDPALLRAGRMDVRERIERLDRESALAMFQAYQPDAAFYEFDRLVGGRLPIAAADLQGLLQDTPVISTLEAQAAA